MEETDTKQQKMEMSQEEAKQLKYLDFLQIAAVRAAVFVSSVYNFAKENSGPLKSGVQTVEGTVKTVVGPVYEKFHDVPSELLKFADRKVDGIVHVVDRHVPPLVKEATTQALCTAQKAPAIARSVSSEVQRTGVTEAAKTAYAKLQPTAKDLYDSYEPVAERYAVSAWHSLHRLPLFPEVSRVMVPTAAYWSEKYNSAVCFTADHGYTVSAYLPLVPTERIAKVFGGEEGAEVVDKPQAVTAVAVA